MSAEAATLKPSTFRAGGLQVHRLISREGPSPTFVLYRGSARFFHDPAEIRRHLRLTKGSATRDQLIAWFDSFDTDKKPRQTFLMNGSLLRVSALNLI